jgi:hypothetical protein
MIKACPKCGLSKDAEKDFYAKTYFCKPCHNKAMGEYAKLRKARGKSTLISSTAKSQPINIDRAYTIVTALRNAKTLAQLLACKALVS